MAAEVITSEMAMAKISADCTETWGANNYLDKAAGVAHTGRNRQRKPCSSTCLMCSGYK